MSRVAPTTSASEAELAAVSLALIDEAQRRVHVRTPGWIGVPLAQLPMIFGFTALLSSDEGARVPAAAVVLIGVLWVAGFGAGVTLLVRLRTPAIRYAERWPRTGSSPVAAGLVYAAATVVSFVVAVQLRWWWFGLPAAALVLAAYAFDNHRWHAAFGQVESVGTARARAAQHGALVGKPFDDADAVFVMAALVVLQRVRMSALGSILGLSDDETEEVVGRLQDEGVAWLSPAAERRDGWVEAVAPGRRAFKPFVRRLEAASTTPRPSC